MRTPLLVILAGGASSRLWPLEEKSLIKFMGRPLLSLQLENYARLGLTRSRTDYTSLTLKIDPGRARLTFFVRIASVGIPTTLQATASGAGLLGDSLKVIGP